jgi:glycosyltransferase involved in cell wall biosynthesis
MGTLRIDGDPPRDLSRDQYDLLRRNLLEPKAVCHAPFGALHVGARLLPCRHGAADLGDATRESLRQAFAGDAATALRERFRRYEVRRDECGRCVHHWEDRCATDSPAIREFDRELPPVNGVPPRLVSLSLDLRAGLPEARLAEARALLPELERVTLLCDTLAPGSPAAQFAKSVDDLHRDPRPQLKVLAIGFVPAAAEVPPATAAVEIELPIAPLDAAVRERLAELAEELSERRSTLVVRGSLGRSNWAALRQFFSEVRGCDAAVAIEAFPKDHPDSLAALDGDLLAVIHGICWRFGTETAVAGDERKGGAELRAVLHRLREWQRTAADRAGAGASLPFPSLDHPLLSDEGVSRRLLEDLLRAWHHPQVGDWFESLAREPRFAAAAPSRLSLRLVALWRRVVFDRAEIDPLLAATWRDARSANERVAADREALRGSPLCDWHDGWVRTLKLETRPRGGAPFPPAKPRRAKAGRADVTVVIPSFNHERFVGQAIDSALSQAGPRIRVLLVDDASTDSTVAVASLRKDRRLTVRRNPRNLGLGESLRRALERVRTPYVAILNSDDVFHPRRLERLLRELKRRPRGSVAASLVVPIDAEGRQLTGADSSPLFDGRKIHDWMHWFESGGAPPPAGDDLLGTLFQRNWLLSSSNMLCRRDWLQRHANEWKDLEYCVDWQVFLSAAARDELRVVREPLLGYRLHVANTVWFDEQRAWRFYVESHRVVARALEARLRGDRHGARGRFDALLQLVARHVSANRDLDWAGIWLGLLLERLKIPSSALRHGGSVELLRTLDAARKARLHASDVAAAIGDDLAGALRDRGEAAWLRGERQRGEALAGEAQDLRSQLVAALAERRGFERQWHQVERERDAEIAGTAELQRQIGSLDRAVDVARQEAEFRTELLAQHERAAQEQNVELEQLRRMRGDLTSSLETLRQEHERVRLDIEEAMRLLGSDQLQASGSLNDALQTMERGDAAVRSELSQALVRVQAERARVESGLSETLERTLRDRDETRLAADREREILDGALDQLHTRVADLDAALAKARKQAEESRLNADAALEQQRAKARSAAQDAEALAQAALETARQQANATLEQARQQAQSALVQERSQANATLEQARQQAQATLEQERSQANATLEQARQQAQATLEQERSQANATLEQARQQAQAALEQERSRAQADRLEARAHAEAAAAAARGELAQALARERAAAEERFQALLARAALERAELEQEAQRTRALAEASLRGERDALARRADLLLAAAERRLEAQAQEQERMVAAAREEAAAVGARETASVARAEELAARLARIEADLAQQKQLVAQRTWERDDLKRQPEWRLGDLALNTLPLKKPLRFVEKRLSKQKSAWAARKLAAERRGWLGLKSAPTKPRVMATICWNFPIYSQTFVYQELTQLLKSGFDLRIAYTKLDPKDRLHAQFAPLWPLKRPMHLDRPIHEADYKLFKRRFPDRVERLVERLCAAAGMDRERLEAHDNFLQGFTYARLAQAWGADYLHSYFFYDRSLMSLIAGEVLDLPHGVSCYADHVMKDYELKVVPLHLETCDVVIATSHRIKRELLEIAPATAPEKILVKPNAVDCTRFPVISRPEPGEGQPFRLVVTARIEPKKGLIHLAEAVKLLRDQGLNIEAHFVGDCDHGVPASENCKAELCAFLERNQLWGKVHLEGRQPEQRVRHFLSIAHLFVAPFIETESGDKDGIPTALIEAMATGIPSVVTDSGSILEVVDDKVDALVVPQRDAAALAAAIRELLQDARGRKFMGWKAAQKAREKFDVSVCDPWFHERVRSALAKRRKS